ncbi:MAG: hypothetical protein EBZ48_07430 [Proteobacteria bacterium]|nr:hypothetical protein [Pseudomonadota bacterium]
MDKVALWGRFKTRLIHDAASGFSLDTSRLGYDDEYLARMEPQMRRAFDAMKALEAGAIANPDENRMVGHYWLRNPELAPTKEIAAEIRETIAAIKKFAAEARIGAIAPRSGGKFSHVLVVGIGGSALGPQFVNQALSSATDPMTVSFFDNTDPDGMAKVLYSLESLARTLVVVENSELDKTARAEGWLARFPMWDWVGGRTSECSAVGLLPLALQGFPVDEFLQGAAAMDEMTRRTEIRENPAAALALAWYHCGCGKGNKDMVVLPYKDRLELFSRYLQQLVMESLGKELDLSGAVVNQGLAVYGNKGSTDQHAYVQQLRDGLHNFFAVFIEVLRDRSPRTTPSPELSTLNAATLNVEPGITSGDYLSGFLLGTRSALFEKGRESVTITVPDVSANAGGNLEYLVPTRDMVGTTAGDGTSSATPFWAALVTQLNALFKDQKMPQLGYMNDLAYTASAVFPAAFNDIQLGNNTSSFSMPGDYTTNNDSAVLKRVQPTGFGYQAAPGYDLASGLGSPNGYQLAVALTNIARVQLSTATPPTMLTAPGNLGQSVTVSGTQQTLQFQVSSGGDAAREVELSIGSQRQTFKSPASQTYAWTSQLAQQTLQQGFDANLVRLFDGAAQASAIQSIAQDQDQVRVRLYDGASTKAAQIDLSAPYGFVDFSNASLGASVRASRPVSVATTADNADNAEVVVRMRQNGVDGIASFFYRVDSLTGLIDGLAPGQNGYAEAAKARRYKFNDGNTSLKGNGYGNYSQGLLVGVDSGDLIAMGIINSSKQQTFWGFSGANESINGTNVTHIWNYGMNTFGFEDTYGGGDLDFNDAVVQLDYSSASGSKWLLTPPTPLG